MRSALLALLCLLLLPAGAGAAPALHAHRGGPISFGVPDSYENTLPAFERRIAATPGVWLEMDALVSRDGVPFVLHDSTLDRTTTCTGNVVEVTAAEIEACRVDVLGVSSDAPTSSVPAPADGPVVRVPRLADVLALAKRTGAPVNLEIKRIPGDPGYVPGDTSFARRIMEVVAAAGLDPAKLIVQSFDPTNLETAAAVLPGVTRSFLTLAGTPAEVALCAARGYAFLSPNGVPDAVTMAAAKASGIRVVPYTLDGAGDVRAAAAAGVDAIITNDVPLARRALGLEPAAAPAAPGAGARPALAVLSRHRGATLRLGGLAVRLTGPAGASATVVARAGRVVVARGTLALERAGSRRTRLPLTPAGRRILRRARPVVLALGVTPGEDRRIRLR